jgi:hypothetical protein
MSDLRAIAGSTSGGNEPARGTSRIKIAPALKSHEHGRNEGPGLFNGRPASVVAHRLQIFERSVARDKSADPMYKARRH